MQRRFVLLFHTGHGPEHYDLMIQDGDHLATWQLPNPPHNLVPGQSLSCRRLPHHRLAYLDYQGEISGHRGLVKRLAGGLCHAVDEAGAWRLEMGQGRLAGRWRLEPSQAPDAWRLIREV